MIVSRRVCDRGFSLYSLRVGAIWVYLGYMIERQRRSHAAWLAGAVKKGITIHGHQISGSKVQDVGVRWPRRYTQGRGGSYIAVQREGYKGHTLDI